MRGKLENFSVKQSLGGWYVSDATFRDKEGGAYVHSNLEVYPSMNSVWSGGNKGEYEYLNTRKEAEKRLSDFLKYQTFVVWNSSGFGWYVGNKMDSLGLDKYVHEDLEIHPSMRGANDKLQYL